MPEIVAPKPRRAANIDTCRLSFARYADRNIVNKSKHKGMIGELNRPSAIA